MEADFLVLPEYAGLEWIWPHKKDFNSNIEFFQSSGLKAYQQALLELAKTNNIIIFAGSVPALDMQYYNRCYVVYPSGKLLWQDKIQLTPSEKALGWLKGSDTLKIFNSDFGKFAICICYDSEFPELTSQAVMSGANVLFVPSYTDSNHGAQRIRVAAQARAMENQSFVITATCVGKAVAGDFSCDEFDGTATGEAGIFTPIDHGFAETGILNETTILAESQKSAPKLTSVIKAKLDFALMDKIRKNGQVRNFWDRINLHPITIKQESL